MKSVVANKELSFDLLKGLVISPVTNALNFAILGAPGSGKTTFCQNLLREAVEGGMRCVYVITNNPINLIKDQVRAWGLPPSRIDQIIYVDMYSWLLGERSSERFQIDNASDVASLSVVLSNAADAAGDRCFVVFDSLSTLLAYNSEELSNRFMKSHLARMKKHNNIGAYAVELGIHTNSFYNEVRSSFDGVIDLKLDEIDGELR
ncbi:MAG TPA: RAD55 family ATPase, partial [Candidatus Bathyarchaeia archaeon]|nr:RAD55 family ATPase [Candidatus Bathyarchaeia archaeon]